MPSSLLSFLCPEDPLCQHINNDWSLPSAMLTCSSPSFLSTFIIKPSPSYWCYVDLLLSQFLFLILLHGIGSSVQTNDPRKHAWIKTYIKSWWSIAKPENINCSKAFLEAVLETQHEPVANSRRAHHPSPRILREQLIQDKKNCCRATHLRSRFQGSGLKVLGSCSHAISSASYLPTHTTQAIWSKAMLPKGNLVRTTFKAMSKCSVPLFKGEHSLWNTTPTLKWHLCGAIIVWYIHPLILISSRHFVVDSNGNCAYCGLD